MVSVPRREVTVGQYELFHRYERIGESTDDEAARLDALVKEDPDRFNKWKSRVGAQTFSGFRRTLPFGNFVGFGRKAGE